MTIYVDVLFVLNFFITYLLLLLTKLLNRREAKTYRLIIASFIGGIYSLVIIVDELNFLITIFGKILVSVLIVFTAFGFNRLTLFLKNILVFYFSNMILLGVILAIWLVFRPDGVVIHNNSVYFDISARALLLSAFFAYILSVAIVKIYNHTLGSNEIYSLTIFSGENQWHMFAFADSGNKLKEPFSDYPVIIVDKSKLSVDTNRVIPFNTVGGEGLLEAFKPDKVIISTGKRTVETDKVYIALSTVESKDFSAIINPEILKYEVQYVTKN